MEPLSCKSRPPLIVRIVMFLATGLGLGRSPIAPGTIGSLLGLPLTWAILWTFPGNWPIQLAVIVGLIVVGVPICSLAARSLNQKDPGSVVWDEIVTIPIVFLGCSPADGGRVEILLIGFLLHRLYDITKPPPVCHLERLPGGLGIMMDDVAAALYGLATFRLLLFIT